MVENVARWEKVLPNVSNTHKMLLAKLMLCHADYVGCAARIKRRT